jgi:hypothetical protein
MEHQCSPETRALIAEAAEEGATRALARIGLADEDAGRDVLQLRGLMEAWRQIKKGALQALGKALTVAILAGLALLAGKHWSGQ